MPPSPPSQGSCTCTETQGLTGMCRLVIWLICWPLSTPIFFFFNLGSAGQVRLLMVPTTFQLIHQPPGGSPKSYPKSVKYKQHFKNTTDTHKSKTKNKTKQNKHGKSNQGRTSWTLSARFPVLRSTHRI